MAGFTPREVDDMSLWEFNAAIGGIVKARGGEDGEGLSLEEAKELAELIDGHG